MAHPDRDLDTPVPPPDDADESLSEGQEEPQYPGSTEQEIVDPLGDAAEEVIDRPDPVQVISGLAAQAVHDDRLLTAKGVAELREELPNEHELLNGALDVVEAGNRSLSEGQLPIMALSLESDPIQAYLGCLQFVDHWIDTYSKTSEPLEDPNLALMLSLAHQADYAAAQAEVARIQAGQATELHRLGTEEVIELMKPSTTTLILHDTDGEPTETLKTFTVCETTLGEDEALQGMPVSGTMDIFNMDWEALFAPEAKGKDVTLFSKGKKLREALFPKDEYPDAAIVDQSTVEYVVGVAPITADDPAIYYKLELDGPDVEATYEVDIVTAEKWHTSNMKLMSKSRRTLLGVPSSAERLKMELFIAQAESVLGDQRRAALEQMGVDASRSVITVFKPLISPSKASFRREVLKFLNGPQGEDEIGDIARSIHYNDHADSADWLAENGWLGEPAKAALVIAKCLELDEIKRRRELDVPKGGYGGGGWGAGAATMSMMGPRSTGVDLHSSASGIESGRIGVSQERYEVDPFTPPKIIVFRPMGVQSLEQ